MFKRKHYNLSPFDTKKTARNKMRSYRRGYLLYKKKNKIFIFRKIKGELNQTIIYFDKFFFNILCLFYKEFKKINFDLVISQYTFQKSRIKRIYLDMILYSLKKKKIFQPLTKEYCKILKKNQYEVSNFSYYILWPLFCLLFWGYGNLLFLKILIKSFFNLFKKNIKNIDHYFFSISENNLPFKSNDKSRKSYDLISWFNNYYQKELNIKKNISHDNKVLPKKVVGDTEIFFSDEPWFYLGGFIKLLIFFFSGVFFSLVSLILIFINKPTPSFLFPEILKSISVILSDKNNISKKYLFHYSETYYRPLWTYLIKNDDKNIICYFYSTYDAPTNKKTNEIGHFYEFGNITWPTILVWDETQKKKLLKYARTDIINTNVINTGPIWFTDTKFTFKNNKKKIVIFDMTVHRISVHYGFYDVAEYTDDLDNFNCLFLNDIFSTFKSTNLEIILKRKRPSKYLKTNYRSLVKRLSNEGLKIIDDPVSAYYLTENSEIVFSTPFTSANLMTKRFENNYYYDPACKILKNDIAARGISIISGKQELHELKNKLIWI